MRPPPRARKPRQPPRLPKNPLPPPPPPARPERSERLHKLLAAAGLGSRRAIEAWIEAGRVGVNGRTARIGECGSPADRITVDGVQVRLRAAPAAARVLAYHKPEGELVTRSDPAGRPTVFARLPALAGARWIAVGRLDINSCGLLLLTDSGDLANRLMHPRHRIEREYAVRVLGELSAAERERLLQGVMLDGRPARFGRVEAAPVREGADRRQTAGPVNRWYRVTLDEGRNREVRRLFEALGRKVSRLVRVRYGPIGLPRDLQPGQWRELARHEVLQLESPVRHR